VAWRKDFFGEQLLDIQDYPRSECLRSKEWKYIRYFKRTVDKTFHTLDGTCGTHENYLECLTSTLSGEEPVYEELYHLAQDLHEENSLAENDNYRHVLEGMRERTITLGREALGDGTGPLTLPLEERYESE
jgi:hypothetical protein